MSRNLVIVLAGGSGKRLGGEMPKQFFPIGGKEILAHTVAAFQNHEDIDVVHIVSGEDYIDQVREIVMREKFTKVSKIIPGGAERQDSSRAGVTAADEKFDKVLIHDAARPFVSAELIDRILGALDEHKAVNVAIPSRDTVVAVDDDGCITDVPDRKMLRLVQTPQAFRGDLIREAHKMALAENYNKATDDCSLILRYKMAEIMTVEGEETNIKITYPFDMDVAEIILKRK